MLNHKCSRYIHLLIFVTNSLDVQHQQSVAFNQIIWHFFNDIFSSDNKICMLTFEIWDFYTVNINQSIKQLSILFTILFIFPTAKNKFCQYHCQKIEMSTPKFSFFLGSTFALFSLETCSEQVYEFYLVEVNFLV